jgi:hypothetical protein
MAGLEQIEEITNRVIKQLKKVDDKARKGEWENIKLDDQFHDFYVESIKQSIRIKPHSTTQYYPANLFKHLSPHRQEEEKEWIRNNYEPITLPVWMDFVNTCKRGANRQNYRVVWQTEFPSEYRETNNPKEYIEDGIKLYTSLHGWFSNTLFDNKLKDANAVVAVQPYQLQTEVLEDGTTVINEMVSPIPIYYQSWQVLDFDEDEWYLLMSTEKVKLEGTRKGYILYFFDRDTIYEVRQVGRFQDFEFEINVHFEHNWGAVPVWKMMGHPEMKHEHIYFQSPFDYAVGNLNLSLKNHINKQMAEANGSWPHKIMIAPVCDNKGDDDQLCRVGHIWKDNLNGDGSGGDVTCSKCNGTGFLDKPSPGSTLMVDESQLIEGSVGLERIKFISPSSEILKHLAETVKENENRARNILHIYSTNDQSTGGKDTATGKWIDNNAMIAFIMPIVDEAFTIYQGVLQAIVYMRYGDAIDSPTIIPPTGLDYKTASDLLSEYTDLLASNAPPIVLYKALEKYTEKMFSSAGDESKIFRLILSSDSVITKKDDEIRNMIGAGTLPKWKAILHNNIFNYIGELIESDQDVLEKPLPELRAMLIERAKQDEIESKPTIETDIIGAVIGNRGTT